MNAASAAKRCWLLTAVLATALGTSTQADTPALVLLGVSPTPPPSFTGTRGWQFLPWAGLTNDILITQLGVFDAGGDGLVNAHEVGLWRQIDNLTGVLLTSVTVPAGTAAPLNGGYRWVPISPVAIPPDITTYVVAAQYSAGDVDNLVTPYVDSFPSGLVIYPDMGRGALGSNLPYPAGGGPTPYWQPNLQFTLVPEPSVWLLLSPGLLYLLFYHRKPHWRPPP
jgi:hypothetical protein